jgi:GT2 family glycosyltransferase
MDVDFVSGCAMFIRRDVFEKIGLFDEKLLMYGEEVDFCWRARLAGYTLGCVTPARMWHKVSLSASRVGSQTRYLRIRNQIRFYNNYARGLQRPIMFLFSILRSGMIILKDIFRRQTDLIPPLIRGWVDGWKP